MITAFRLILGGVFLLSGISKLPIFRAFEYSIAELLPLSGIMLTATAVLVIAAEILAGGALLLNKKTQFFSGLIALMMAGFIVFLSMALFEFQAYICTCFGVLGLDLPVDRQIVVDFLLLNMAVMVFIFGSSESGSMTPLRNRAGLILTPVLFVSIIWSAVILLQPRAVFGVPPEIDIDAHAVFTTVPARSELHPRLVFMVDFADFLCPQCLDDFLAMGNRLAGSNPHVQHVHVLARRIDFMEESDQRNYIETWRNEYNYPLPIEIDIGNVFSRSRIDESIVLLFTPLGSLIDTETFPMGSQRRSEIVDRFLR